MISHLSYEFEASFEKLPERIKKVARKNYKIWKNNPKHPGLEFKRIHTKLSIYSIRVGYGWRAMGSVKKNIIVWFWIGSHSDYDKLIKLF